MSFASIATHAALLRGAYIDGIHAAVQAAGGRWTDADQRRAEFDAKRKYPTPQVYRVARMGGVDYRFACGHIEYKNLAGNWTPSTDVTEEAITAIADLIKNPMEDA